MKKNTFFFVCFFSQLFFELLAMKSEIGGASELSLFQLCITRVLRLPIDYKNEFLPPQVKRALLKAEVEVAPQSKYHEKLCEAAINNDIEMAQVLLEFFDVDVNKASEGFMIAGSLLGGMESTPLLEAASMGHAGMVRLLLDHGAKTEIMNKFNMTPLHFVSCMDSVNDQIGVVQMLLDAKANIWARNHIGDTPLQSAEKELSECSVDQVDKIKQLKEIISLLRQATKQETDKVLKKRIG